MIGELVYRELGVDDFDEEFYLKGIEIELLKWFFYKECFF